MVGRGGRLSIFRNFSEQTDGTSWLDISIFYIHPSKLQRRTLSIIVSLSRSFENFPSYVGWRMVAAGTPRVAAVVGYDGLEVDPSEVGP